MTAATHAPTVVVVGSASRDVTADDPRGWRLGGGVSYSALTTARLGLRTAALIGVDSVSAHAHELDLLRQAGVEVTLAVLDHAPIFEIHARPGGRVLTCLDAGSPILPDALPRAWRDAPAWILAPVAAELPDAWASVPSRDACVAFGWQGILRRLAAGEHVEPLPPGHSPFLARADLIAASRDDFTAEVTIEEIGRLLQAETELVLTSAEQGGLLIRFGRRGRTLARYPALPSATPLDPTGAGDVLLASLLAAHLAGRGNRRHGSSERVGGQELRLAAATASLEVEGLGLNGVPTLAAVKERLASFGG